MTEYNEAVAKQAIILKAEVWAKQVSQIHVHGLDSMGYDDHPEDTEGDKRVTDYSYFSGIVKRYQDGELLRIFGEEVTGEDLISKYGSYCHDSN